MAQLTVNLTRGGGDFTPYIKYNAKAGRWYTKAEDLSGEVEIVNPRLVFDLEAMKTGWICFPEGAPPEKVWDPQPGIIAPKPAGPRKWQRGFEVMAFGPDSVPRVGKLGLREFCSNAINVQGAMLDMVAAYNAGIDANSGKLPLFQCNEVRPIEGRFGTNYEPVFTLIKWIEPAKVPDLIAARHAEPPAPVSSSNHQAPLTPGKERLEDVLDDEIPF